MRSHGVLLGGVLLSAGLAAGCAGLPRHPSLPEDPLLVSKKAVRGKAEYTPPVLLARSDMVLPPEPAPALLAASPALRQEFGVARQLYTVPVNMPRPPRQEPSGTEQGPSSRDPHRTVSYTP
jgi:hypothetical protein